MVSSYAQVTDGVPGRGGVAFPSSCSVPLPIGKREADDPEDIVRRLNSGELSAEGEDDAAPSGRKSLVARPPAPFRCEDGPKSVIIIECHNIRSQYILGGKTMLCFEMHNYSILCLHG